MKKILALALGSLFLTASGAFATTRQDPTCSHRCSASEKANRNCKDYRDPNGTCHQTLDGSSSGGGSSGGSADSGYALGFKFRSGCAVSNNGTCKVEVTGNSSHRQLVIEAGPSTNGTYTAVTHSTYTGGVKSFANSTNNKCFYARFKSATTGVLHNHAVRSKIHCLS